MPGLPDLQPLRTAYQTHRARTHIMPPPPLITIQVDFPPGSPPDHHSDRYSAHYPAHTDCSKYCTAPSDPASSTQPSLPYIPTKLRSGSIQSPITPHSRASQHCSHLKHPVQPAFACQSSSHCNTTIPALSTCRHYLPMPSSLRHLPDTTHV